VEPNAPREQTGTQLPEGVGRVSWHREPVEAKKHLFLEVAMQKNVLDHLFLISLAPPPILEFRSLERRLRTQVLKVL
jgi:hypothetical protein